MQNNAAVTDSTNIGLTWSPGLSDGGADVIDYKLWYTHAETDNFIELETALTTTSYTTGVTLQVGENYKFKV